MTSFRQWDEFYSIEREARPLIWPDVNLVRLVSRAGLSKGSKVLDVACGEGRNARALLEMGYDVTVIEQSCAALGLVERLYGGMGVRSICSDIYTGLENLSEEYFDLIAVWGVLHFLPDPESVLRLANNLLTEDGVLVSSFTSKLDSCNRVEEINRYYSESDVFDLLEKTSFDVKYIGLENNQFITENKIESYFWTMSVKR